jgi:protease I
MKEDRMADLTDFRVAVVATDGFEESELTQPVAALRDSGALVTILAPQPGQIQGVRHDLDKTVRVEVDRPIGGTSAPTTSTPYTCPVVL